MRTRKNTLVLFSKLPEVGKVKTRLTVLKDGIFQPEVASALYHCMLFDVVEIIMAAMTDLEERSRAEVEAARRGTPRAACGGYDFPPTTVCAGAVTGAVGAAGAEGADADVCVASTPDVLEAPDEPVLDVYELVVSTAPAHNVEAMRRLFSDAGIWPREMVFIADEGANFDEHYNHAFQQAWDRGADCILSMGADMPALTKKDVFAGFEALHALEAQERGGIVLAPDQAMGVSVVGWPRKTAFDHTGVYYNKDGYTVLPAYIAKAREAQLPVLYLPSIPDVDTMGDLMHNVTLVEALNYCAASGDDICPPWRTADALKQMGWSEVRVPPNDLHDPREEIDV